MTTDYAKVANHPVPVRVTRINRETTFRIIQRAKFDPTPRLVKK